MRHPETMRGRFRAALKVHHYAKYCARFYAIPPFFLRTFFVRSPSPVLLMK